jgi:hypothetical protein
MQTLNANNLTLGKDSLLPELNLTYPDRLIELLQVVKAIAQIQS